MIRDAILSIKSDPPEGLGVMEKFNVTCFSRKTNSDYEEFEILYNKIKTYNNKPLYQ